jgi:hypothetical protein
MLTTTIAVSLAVAFFTLVQHHRRAVARHDRSVEAWCAALRLVESCRSIPTSKALPKPRAKPAPARLPAPRRRRA